MRSGGVIQAFITVVPGKRPQAAKTRDPYSRRWLWVPGLPRHAGSPGTTVQRYSPVRRSRSALPTTLTEDSAIAAAAIIGDSRMPKKGYRTPAAIGTPAEL